MKDEKLHQAIYSAIAHGISGSNAVASDIKTATSNVMQVVMRNIHEELEELEESEAHIGGEIPVSDLFENAHINHFVKTPHERSS